MTIDRPMFPPRAASSDSFPLQPAIGPDSQALTSESPSPFERAPTTATIFKFPHDVSRRAFARMPRNSKNGTPEERTAKQPGHDRKPNHSGNNPLRARLASVSIAITMVGKAAVYRRHGFDPATLSDCERRVWLEDLQDGARDARQIAHECDEAILLLGGELPAARS
jgi:hypothetical protein